MEQLEAEINPALDDDPLVALSYLFTKTIDTMKSSPEVHIDHHRTGCIASSVPGLPRSRTRIYLSACGTRIVGQERGPPSPFLCVPHALINCAYVNARGRPGTEATGCTRTMSCMTVGMCRHGYFMSQCRLRTFLTTIRSFAVQWIWEL